MVVHVGSVQVTLLTIVDSSELQRKPFALESSVLQNRLA
jgi:hypothetical protein